jgi:uncharacterized protein (TIGR02246 family)
MGVLYTMQDDAVIRQLVRDCANAWNKQDGVAFGQPLAEDADYRTIWGIRLHGRAIISQMIFDAPCRGVRLETQIEGIRFIRPDVAYIEATSKLHNATIPFEKVVSAIVAVKANGEWRIVTFHNAGALPGDHTAK